VYNFKHIVDLYLEESHWVIFWSDILEAISKVCFLPNPSTKISKNKASACFKKYNALKLHIIRKFASREVLSNIDGRDGRKFAIEWKSILFTLALRVSSITHRNLPNGKINKSLLGSLDCISTSFIVPEKDSPIAPILYYISGWLLTTIEKESIRRGSTVIAGYLEILVEKCTCIDAETSGSAGLPTEKVDRVCAFGGLKYPSSEFFCLVGRFEHVFSSVLTNANLALHGGKLLRVILHHIETNDSFIKQVKSFFINENKSDEDVINEVITYILKTYTRMRGKDIVYKIMARGSFKPKLHIQQECAAVVNVETYRKLKKKSNIVSEDILKEKIPEGQRRDCFGRY